MNYQQLIRNLLDEAKQGIRYKQWGQPQKAFAIIAMIPFYASVIFCMVGYYVLLFLYNAFLAPVNYLEAWLEEKGSKVHPATQAVTYLVAMPVIFFLRVMVSFCSFWFFFQWFSLMTVLYIATYGGIRWQPFINTATFDKEYTWTLRPSKEGSGVFAIILFSLFAAMVFMYMIFAVAEEYDLLTIASVFQAAYYIDAAILVPCIFKKQEVSDVVVESVDCDTLPADEAAVSSL